MNSTPKQYQPFMMAEERAARSVFVGNIPYEATEEQLKEIFGQAGPVVSFRLVYDRETGKPKGYGFCEYQDLETAQSAMRNLNNHDFNGRPLRVGVAAGEQTKDENRGMQQALGGPAAESPYGEPVEPEKAPEAVARAVASLPPEQMFELMKQMKMCIQNNPNEARNMLLQNPQLAYALLQAQIVMKIVDPQVALAMLHRQTEQIPPMMPSSSSSLAQQPAMSSGPGPGPGPMQSSQAPVGVPNAPGASRLPAPSALLGPPNNMIGPGTDFGPRGPRGGILGDMPFADQPPLDHPELGPAGDRRGGPGPLDRRDVGPMMDRRDMVPPMDRTDLPGLMDRREPGPPVDRREFGPPMDRREGPLGHRDGGPFPPGHLGPPLERRDLGPPRREFERRDFGSPMERHDAGPAGDPRDMGPMMDRPGPPMDRPGPPMDRPGPPMDRRDIPMDRRDFPGPRGPEPGGRGHPGFMGDPRGPPRSEMMGRSPRMDDQGMDMGPRMRPPLDPRADLGRGGPMGPRPNFVPGLGRGGRPEGEMGMGPRMDMGPAGPRMDMGPSGQRMDMGPSGPRMDMGPSGPRMDMGPSGPRMDMGPSGPRMEMGPSGPRMEMGPRAAVPDMRDPRQAADPRRMAVANATVRPSEPPSTTVESTSGRDQEKAALIMQVLQLSDEQIAMLPEDQRQSIMILKEQLAHNSS